ncbi:MAG: glycosyltransferase [Rhodobacterales bacterium]|nr:glycosyltransferase [Rhodobacterales bacterium]
MPSLPSAPALSVVVPVFNEADNIRPLVDEIRAALDGRLAYEIVYVDDGSSDATPHSLAAARADGAPLRVIRHAACCGQSAAVATGVAAARGPVIATLDGDGQNDPANIPDLMAVLEAADDPDRLLVAGLRAKRKDTWIKRVSSRIANRVRGGLLRDNTPDTGCGLKVFTRAAFLDMPRFDHMHRFLPALMIRRGGRVVSVPVNHRPRERGASKYGTLDRLAVGIVDLFGVFWLQRRASRPVVSEVDLGGAGPEEGAS